MFHFRGPATGPAMRVPRPARIGLTIRAAVLAACAHALVPAAADDRPLTLEAAEALALEAEPGREGHEARAEALTERAVAAGELPDPELRVGLANFPIESGGFATEGMTQSQLGLRQRFPPGDTLEHAAERYRRLADEQSFAASARERDVRYALRAAWLELHYRERAREVVRETRPLFADLLTVTRSLYSVGNRDQQDVLRAELELSRLDEHLLTIEEQVALARAALAEWIGEAAERPLPAALPGFGPPPALADLEASLESHPALVAVEARGEASQAAIAEAREAFRPGWALDLGYGYRDGRLPDGTSRSDFLSLSVTVDLPFLGRERRNRALVAALAERRAVDADREQLRRRLASRLAADHARWQSLGRRIELARETILPQAEARAAAALVAYQSEAGDFADVMRGRIDVLDALLEVKRLETGRAKSRAALARFGGH